MIVNIILILVALLGVSIIIYISVRKFPQLANLDVVNLPQEKEALKKKEIISRRLDVEGQQLKAAWKKRFEPVRKLWGQLQLQFRIYVGRVEHLWHHEQMKKNKRDKVVAASSPEILKRNQEIVQQGLKALEEGRNDHAEELFISAIKKDPKFAPAYRGLAEAYFVKESWDEALETFLFLLQLQPHDDAAMCKVGEIYAQQGDYEKSIDYYQQAIIQNDSLSPRFYRLTELLLKIGQPQTAKEAILAAVDLEPKNPKYLDLLAEIGILCGNKALAQRACNELRAVNPENQKLADFQERIKVL